MTEFKANTFDQDDMAAVLSEYDDMDVEAEEIMAEARGRVGGIRKRQKEHLRRAADELGIPTAISKPLIKQRKLELKLKRNAESVSEEWTEVFEEASGQFSLFAPDEDEEPTETVAEMAAKRRAKKAKVDQEAEQEVGTAVLDSLTKLN